MDELLVVSGLSAGYGRSIVLTSVELAVLRRAYEDVLAAERSA